MALAAKQKRDRQVKFGANRALVCGQFAVTNYGRQSIDDIAKTKKCDLI